MTTSMVTSLESSQVDHMLFAMPSLQKITSRKSSNMTTTSLWKPTWLRHGRACSKRVSTDMCCLWTRKSSNSFSMLISCRTGSMVQTIQPRALESSSTAPPARPYGLARSTTGLARATNHHWILHPRSITCWFGSGTWESPIRRSMLQDPAQSSHHE